MSTLAGYAALPPLVLVWLLAGLLAASLARGYAGFGFSAVLVASWALVTDPARAVVLALILEVAASVLQARSVWREVPWRRVAVLLAGAACGTPVGVWLLAHLAPDAVRLAVALFVLAAACAMLAGLRLARRAGTAGTLAVGLASGAANGAVAMGGLPVALFLAAEGEAPARMRAAMIAYFFVLDLLALALLARADLVAAGDLAGALAALPVLLLFMTLGARQFARGSVAAYRRVTLWMLVVLALLGLARALATG